MNNDDLRRGSNDESRTRPSDTPNADPQVNVPEFPEFGELPGFTPLPDLAPLPELAPLPDFGDFLNDTPPVIPDEAVASPADSESSPTTDLFPGVASLPELTPLPAITDLLPDAASSPGDEAAQAEGGNNWPQVEDIPTTASLPLPDAFPKVEAAPTPTETVSAAAATASSRRTSEGDRTPTALRAPAPEPSRTWVDKTAIKRKPSVVMIVLGCILALNVAVSLFSPGRSGSSSTPSSHQTTSSTSTATNMEEREHAANLPARAPGYRGSATNTHSISPQWSSGVATAWTLELPPEMTQFGPQMFAEGQVLYIAGNDTIEGQRGSAVRTQAYDLSGEEPTLLWDTVGPTENSAIMTYTPAFVSSETQLFFLDVVIDKATGEQTQAPWGKEFPIAQADGIVVTCSTTSSCSGWTHTSGEWTNLWTTPTNPLASYGFANHGLGYTPKGAVLSGTGTRASVLVPTSYQESPQIINIHTGEATTLPEPGTPGTGHYVEVGSDGFVVLDIGQKQGMAFDSAGTLQSTFTSKGQAFAPAVSRDGTYPSTADLTTFMTYQRANWSTGTVALMGKNDCSIQVTLSSDGSTHTTPVPGALSPYMTSSCYFEPKEVRVSADASVLYADTFTYQDKSRYFIDTVNGLIYTSPELNEPKQTMWVFDDMMIGLTQSEIKAFVPASS